MNMSEKVAALSNPEYGKHYSSLSDKDILHLWDTTPPNDTERYFIYREILGSRPGVESRLLSSKKKEHEFFRDDEYLVAEHKEGVYGDGGFATTKSRVLYLCFVAMPLFVLFAVGKGLKLLGKTYVLFGVDNSWIAGINIMLAFLWFVFWVLWAIGCLTHSYFFITNQRIGSYRKILRIFKLPPKWMDLDGHFISGTQMYAENLAGTFGNIGTKKEVLSNAYLGTRLDKYSHLHQRINLVLNVGTSIYMLELIKFILSRTKAVLYIAPICYPGHNKELVVNYRFPDSHLEDLPVFFKTIDRRATQCAKNVGYLGKTNMECLADFFETLPEATLLSNTETILAYFPGAIKGWWNSATVELLTDGAERYLGWKEHPIVLTTNSIKCYTKNKRKVKFEYSWSDPNLTVGISVDSIDFVYKEKKEIGIYWDVIDIPIIDILKQVGIKEIYSSPSRHHRRFN